MDAKSVITSPKPADADSTWQGPLVISGLAWSAMVQSPALMYPRMAALRGKLRVWQTRRHKALTRFYLDIDWDGAADAAASARDG